METTSRMWMPALVAAAVVALVVLVVLVVGQRGGPPVIRLTTGGAVSVAPVEASTDEVAPGPGVVVVFRFALAEQARFGAGEATAWRFQPPAALDVAVAGLAARLGVAGDPVTAPDGSVTIGPDDGTGPTLWVGPTGEWWFGAPPCDLDVDEPEPDCPPAPAAAGVVPDEGEARAAAEAFFADVNPTVTLRVTETLVDEQAALVVASLLVAGEDTDVLVSVAFGADMTVAEANGTLARPTQVSGYPTIDADAAVARLEDQHARQDWGKVLADLESDETEVRTATLGAVEPRLLTIVDADGIQWLLPGVRFTDSDGRSWEVVTVADDHLAVTEGDAPEPLPIPVEVDGPEPTASTAPATISQRWHAQPDDVRRRLIGRS